MTVLAVLVVIFGIYWLSVAVEAFGYDEPVAGALAGLLGSTLVIVGMKVIANG